jgi:hypothetical protein
MSDIKREQSAFDEQLPKMLEEHPGEYVVFHEGVPAGFFPDLPDAYEFALSHYGPDGVFLIEQIAQPSADISSLTWEVGAIGLQ